MDIVSRSDVGRVRSSNEDFVALVSRRGLAVLADGMGGLDAGEVASRIAAESIVAHITRDQDNSEALIRDAITIANERVFELARDSISGSMGTTVVLWADIGFGQSFVAHVGDSRAYRLRRHSLEALTEDHSVVQQLVNEGVLSELEARVSPNRNVITRAVGLEESVAAEIRSCVHVGGDVFMLCSDGLTDMLTEAEINRVLRAHLAEDGAGSLAYAAESLVSAANAAGGFDNVSVVLIRPG